ncbi:MAG: sigma-54-dependent Fis family transcriptional regulator [Blastocatellia bacterium]
MVGNSFSQDEQARLAVLRRFENLDAAPEPALDSITALVAWFFNAPVSVIVLILRDHIIVKSLYGLEQAQADRWPEWRLAATATDDVFCLADVLEDPRSSADLLVAGEFGLRFYAAAPLRTREGYSLGTLSVSDRNPRDISVSEKEFLRRMAALVVDLIESRLTANRLFTLIVSFVNEARYATPLAADERLLQVLAESLARALDVAYVFIGAPGEHGAGAPDTVAFYVAGAVIGRERNYYRAANWPYIPLMHADQDEIYYPSKTRERFPHERRLADLQIESYAGIKLADPLLRGFGAIAILDTKPIKDLWLTRSALAAFASLALAELKRRRASSVGWNQSEASAGRFRISFNQSIIGKPKAQQLAWLADQLLGDSPAIQEARELLRLAIIKQPDSVLFMGETGTGKGVCALAIHEGSGARGRFIEVNCAALPHELIESELFGHEKGSFTGATGRAIGLFEQADGGTIFLDEIVELPPDLQVKLLTVLQRRELRRVGGDQAIPINVRVIAATNRPLEIALNDGAFRRDLFFRIGSWRIELPPLRNRGDDVIRFARYFIAELAKSKGYRVEGLAPEAEDLLKRYDWPGNVRQLLNVIEHAIILEGGDVISPQTIYHTLEEEKRLFTPNRPTGASAPQLSYKDLKRILITETEAREIAEALAGNRNNKTKTAKELGLTRGQLNYRLKLIERMSKR